MHDLRAEAGQFEHLIVGDLVELLRGGDDARVGGIDAIHIGVNLAQVCLERRGQGDGCQIRAAAAQGGNLTLDGLALEAGDDDNAALV